MDQYNSVMKYLIFSRQSTKFRSKDETEMILKLSQCIILKRVKLIIFREMHLNGVSTFMVLYEADFALI